MMSEQNKQNIERLMSKYHKLSEIGGIGSYNEAQTRNEFIEPLFECLGWDMRNLSSSNEVVTEQSVSNGRVDLAFRIDNVPVMFLEAKAMRVDLDQWKWAEQAINYSWNKGVSWSVLTDFESIKIFNAEIPPQNPQCNLFIEIPCSEFISRSDQLWLLSKDSFTDNRLSKEAEKWGKLTARRKISDKLFDDLVRWRNMLMSSLTSSRDFSAPEIEEGVQRLLDRLIFIRTAEDRKIEANHLLSALHSGKTGLFQRLVAIFRSFDASYNSKLFAPHFSEAWQCDDDVLRPIIYGLYNTRDGYRYDFSAISVDVLGGIYEQYLSDLQSKSLVIGKTSKRKGQGIYYTPRHIARHVLTESLGLALAEQQPTKLSILDLACGSGSFLIAAYGMLLESEAEPELFTGFNILRDNIFGVDIDEQAVELAKLNLLLKVLSRRALLPTLQNNIHVGNSLMDFDFTEKFPTIMQQGGFDVIVGNPPYIFSREQKLDATSKAYFCANYKVSALQLNTYVIFIERAFQLLKPKGRLGFIVPNTWLTIDSLQSLRKFILTNTGEVKIINIKDKVFQEAKVDTCLLFFQKTKPSRISLGEIEGGKLTIVGEYLPSQFLRNNYVINISAARYPDSAAALQMINDRSQPLSSCAVVSTGLKAYQIGEGKPPQSKEMKDDRIFHTDGKLDESSKKYLEGRDVRRYHLSWSQQFLRYGDWLAEPRRSVPFTGPRILVRQIPSQPPKSIQAVFVDEEYLNDINSMVVFGFSCNYYYLLAVLNSSIMTYWFVCTFDKLQRKTFPQFKVKELALFPIPRADNLTQQKIGDKAELLLHLHDELHSAPTGSKSVDKIKSKIKAVDDGIDDDVRSLYGLDPNVCLMR